MNLDEFLTEVIFLNLKRQRWAWHLYVSFAYTTLCLLPTNYAGGHVHTPHFGLCSPKPLYTILSEEISNLTHFLKDKCTMTQELHLFGSLKEKSYRNNVY